MKLEFSWQIFQKKVRYQVSSKYVQSEPSCSTWTDRQTDRQTDMTELIVAFRNFANAPKKKVGMKNRGTKKRNE